MILKKKKSFSTQSAYLSMRLIQTINHIGHQIINSTNNYFNGYRISDPESSMQHLVIHTKGKNLHTECTGTHTYMHTYSVFSSREC